LDAPRLAYILLWFPKPSETFIFKEVATLWEMGLDLKVYTLYGRLTGNLSAEMRAASGRAARLGLPYLKRFPADLAYWLRRRPMRTGRLIRAVLLRRPRGWEKTGENFWALVCAFGLARRFERDGIEHLHAPWANGPATAAWLASRLTGRPFSFTARAWDIYPPDNLLAHKLAAATFVRSETGHNIPYLQSLSGAAAGKFNLTYNGVTLPVSAPAPVRLKPPYRLFALGRFVGKKGFRYLLEACGRLRDQGVDFRLTLAGGGPEMGRLKRLARRLGLEGRVLFPGFVSHDRVPGLFQAADLFIMPSIVDASGDRDGIPLVMMEALAHRVPVVATAVSGIPELIRDRETGRLVPEKNPAALAAAIRDLLTDRPEALRLAEAGRRLILERFDPRTNFRRVADLFIRHHRRRPSPAPPAQPCRRG
jgi:glycosyltransferase involved in cell wall biosynthesis